MEKQDHLILAYEETVRYARHALERLEEKIVEDAEEHQKLEDLLQYYRDFVTENFLHRTSAITQTNWDTAGRSLERGDAGVTTTILKPPRSDNKRFIQISPYSNAEWRCERSDASCRDDDFDAGTCDSNFASVVSSDVVQSLRADGINRRTTAMTIARKTGLLSRLRRILHMKKPERIQR